ncbi:MAG: molybdopterin molybdotransferase MoeA [Deltaproteobacteria bacterium]|nr:molybdopterin molybdotransferase MoeA [Deltaproteobacteria bacterium]
MNLREVRKRVLELVRMSEAEWIDLEQAVGRVAAASVRAKVDLPQSGRSGFDGFAIRSADTREASTEAPCTLTCLPGSVAAGSTRRVSLRTGHTVEIFTGAPLPANADAVVPMENVVRNGQRVAIPHVIHAGEGVRRMGEEALKGEELIARGQILTPTRLAILATQGIRTLQVFSRPRVFVLGTGDEVRELGQPTDGPYIYGNNRLLMGWLASCCGGIPVQAGIARDDTAEIAGRLETANGEVVITTGGIGRGGRDCVLDAWARMGVQVICREINLIPGKTSATGWKDNRLFFALPGNPWGAQAVFEELVAPALRKHQGLKPLQRPAVAARLTSSVRKRPGFFKAVRGILKFEGPIPSFEPIRPKDTSLFSILKKSLAFALLDAETEELEAGSQLEVFLHECPLAAYPLLSDSTLC